LFDFSLRYAMSDRWFSPKAIQYTSQSKKPYIFEGTTSMSCSDGSFHSFRRRL